MFSLNFLGKQEIEKNVFKKSVRKNVLSLQNLTVRKVV